MFVLDASQMVAIWLFVMVRLFLCCCLFFVWRQKDKTTEYCREAGLCLTVVMLRVWNDDENADAIDGRSLVSDVHSVNLSAYIKTHRCVCADFDMDDDDFRIRSTHAFDDLVFGVWCWLVFRLVYGRKEDRLLLLL